MSERIKMWNDWRKNNHNNVIYQILVLFNLKHSPTFEIIKLHKFLRKVQDNAVKLYREKVANEKN